MNREFVVAEPTEKTKHRWRSKRGFRKYECDKCLCKKWWDPGFKRIMFMTPSGIITYNTPECKPKI
jgi:hypothetical protein